MQLLKKRNSQVASTLYDRCERLFADNRLLVNTSNGCCDGYLGLISPDGTTSYSLTFYGSKEGCYAIWEHPERPGDDRTSFMYPDGQFRQTTGALSHSAAEAVITMFTPARIDE